MTPKQLEVLKAVEEFTQRNGYAPTLQEVADRLKITKVTVLSHLRQLEKARHVKRSYYRRRGIEVLTPTRRLPVTGRIAAGRPIEAIVHPDELDVLGVMKPGREYFALEVRGDSMIEDHIRDGDYVIIERSATAKSGETVVALLDDGEATLLRARLLISGSVQGVGYRWSCRREGQGRGLVGWVRNLPDGRVEALLQGTKEQVEGMIRWCYRGPDEARVADIVVTYEESSDDLRDFGIR